MSDNMDLPPGIDEFSDLNEVDPEELPAKLVEAGGFAELIHGLADQQPRRQFRVAFCKNEEQLEKHLNRYEGTDWQVGDIIAKPSGGFTVINVRIASGTSAEPQEGDSTSHESEEQSFQGNPPETI